MSIFVRVSFSNLQCCHGSNLFGQLFANFSCREIFNVGDAHGFAEFIAPAETYLTCATCTRLHGDYRPFPRRLKLLTRIGVSFSGNLTSLCLQHFITFSVSFNLTTFVFIFRVRYPIEQWRAETRGCPGPTHMNLLDWFLIVSYFNTNFRIGCPSSYSKSGAWAIAPSFCTPVTKSNTLIWHCAQHQCLLNIKWQRILE